MKPLDNVCEWIEKGSDNALTAKVLSDSEAALWTSFSPEQRKEHIETLLTKPLELIGPEIFYSWYFRRTV